MSFGNCQGCQQPKSSYDWCKGRFGTVYKATWKDGYIGYWNYDENCWKRYEKNCTVSVKILNNSENIQSDLLHQIFSAQNYNISGLIRYYGITQDSTTKNYAIISQYLETNVQNYLNQSNLSSNLLWLEKLEILMDVSSTLLQLHNSDLLHENLHTNNILCNMDNKIILSDLGLTHPSNKLNPKYEIKIPGFTNSYGLLNFIPPEIINGKNYTKESDIYCFGIIIWEIITQGTFFNQNKEINLPIIIKKPQLFKNLPNFPKLPYNLELLISKCWDHNPKKRPTIKIIHKQLREWWIGSWNKNMNDIITPFLNLDKTINNNIKEFDPIYIHNTLDISDDEEVDQSIPKHFKSILYNKQNQEIIIPTYFNNETTNTEETYQLPLINAITNTNIDTNMNVDIILDTNRDANIDAMIDAMKNVNIDTKIDTNADSNINTDSDINVYTNTLTNNTLITNSDVLDIDHLELQSPKDILLKLSKEIEFTKLFEPLSDQFTSYNKKDELYIIPGTFPNTEPYYSKENIFTQSDIIFYNAYLKELVKEMHHYWIMNNLSSILLKNWTMVMRIFFFYILSFIYFIICLFVLNRTTYVVVGYNMFDEELMKNKIGI
ncbi:uncharacterized protein OCT59_007152 [Rhizophagus irregularis]|uniref:uncharacterized protein n=1 Tax=Rhizophagus irregularis TaxID=588596 RepID=UPI0033193021|nr:hypothetical protein OCT59_007152 [Rhizophagus irregularis]